LTILCAPKVEGQYGSLQARGGRVDLLSDLLFDE
jgi:hypothetical protein